MRLRIGRKVGNNGVSEPRGWRRADRLESAAASAVKNCFGNTSADAATVRRDVALGVLADEDIGIRLANVSKNGEDGATALASIGTAFSTVSEACASSACTELSARTNSRTGSLIFDGPHVANGDNAAMAPMMHALCRNFIVRSVPDAGTSSCSLART